MYQITMPYVGSILSENNYKYLTKRTKPYVTLWMKELAEKAKALEVPSSDSYRIHVFGKFTDNRRPDLSNLHKVIGDALKGPKGLGIDDKHFFFVDDGVELGHLDPEVIITIEGGKQSEGPYLDTGSDAGVG